jgi:hypothetical protein
MNYNIPNSMHTSGLLITCQFFIAIITIAQLSSPGKLTPCIELPSFRTRFIWNYRSETGSELARKLDGNWLHLELPEYYQSRVI